MAALIDSAGRQNLRSGPWNLPGFGISMLILVLNLMDALFTLAYLQLNLAEEANPLMSLAYRSSPVGFVVIKLAMVQLGIMILHLNRQFRAAQYALNLGAAVYAGIVSYHVAFIAHLALR
jgi:hypothetical protein